MDRNDLASGRFRYVSWVGRTGSTNADLVEAAHRDWQTPRVLIADEQTHGRGRLDRSWEMQSGGGLMVSFFVPWFDSSSIQLVPIALGLGIVDTIGETGRAVGLKWPNDVVVSDRDGDAAAGLKLSGKKLGGMLSTSVIVDNAVVGVVVGLGCNVSWPTTGTEGLPDAACLNDLVGNPVSVEQLAAELVTRFDAELEALTEFGTDRFLQRYRDRCLTINQDVRVDTGDGVIEGRCTDIDSTGALLLEVDGRQRRLSVGDIVHLRPTK